MLPFHYYVCETCYSSERSVAILEVTMYSREIVMLKKCDVCKE
jgi:hypothetical protein